MTVQFASYNTHAQTDSMFIIHCINIKCWFVSCDIKMDVVVVSMWYCC